MTPDKTKAEFSFTKPAVYKIRVKGVLSANCSDILGEMQISVKQSSGKESESILIGQINDQSALAGVLNTLYEFHHTIISVNALRERL